MCHKAVRRTELHKTMAHNAGQPIDHALNLRAALQNKHTKFHVIQITISNGSQLRVNASTVTETSDSTIE